MISLTAAALTLITAQNPAPIELWRVFKPEERLQYSVEAHMLTEMRQLGLNTYLPSTMEIQYKFTSRVKELKTDGIADVMYERPKFTIVHGETFESPPWEEVIEGADIKALLTISPINEVLNVEEAPSLLALEPGRAHSTSRIAQIDPFLQDLYRMAMFVGNLESAIDLAPILPLDDVAPGDTWKQTVGYQPQRLEGTDRSAVQRLDYVYTYKGLVQSGDKTVHRVVATINFETDALEWLLQSMGIEPEDSEVTKIPIRLAGTAVFDLDMETKRTLKADVNSTGGFEIWTVESSVRPTYEERLTGTTKLRLIASKG